MGLFRNRNKKTIAELEDYYANRNRNSTLMAWIMAFLSLLVTIVVLSLIFFAGRWVYRSLTDNDSSDTSETSQTIDGEVVAGTDYDADVAFDENNQIGQGGSSTSDADSNSEYDQVVTDEAASTSISSDERQQNAANDSATNSILGTETSSEDLPDTGAGETALLILVVTTMLGYFYSRKQQLKN